VQLRPDLASGLEAQQPDAFPAEAESHNEQTSPAIAAGLGIANLWAGTVVDLRFFPGGGEDHGASLR
jgi:hypothetical protein